jgi:hypothetical protein
LSFITPYFRKAKLFEPNFHGAKLFVPIKRGDLSKLENQPRNKTSILPRSQHRAYFVEKYQTECHYVEIEDMRSIGEKNFVRKYETECHYVEIELTK